MWHYLLILILLNDINCTKELSGIFKMDYYSSEYITPNNDILIYEPNECKLYLSKSIQNSPQYNPPSQKILQDFAQDKPETLYFNFINLEPQKIQVSYFNETNKGSFNYGNDSKEYSYISIEEIGNGNFAILHNANETSNNNNSISIATFDFYADNKFNITKTYILNDKTKRVHSNCITTEGNNIVCALTKKDEGKKNEKYIYNYTLILLNNEDETISNEIYIYNNSENSYTYIDDDDYDDDDYYDDDYVSLSYTTFYDEYKNYLIYKFFKIILIENEKFLYCYMTNSGIYCGLAEIKNNKIEVYKETKIFNDFDFNSNLAKDTFHAIKYKDNKIILSLATSSEMKFATLQLSSNSNTFSVKTDKGYYSRLDNHYPFYAKLLKNNNNELILFMINGLSYYSSTTLRGYIDELEFISCKNSTISLYNADKKTLEFITYPSFLIDAQKAKSLYLFEIGNEINSIYSGYDIPIELNKQYSKSETIYYNFTSEDYYKYTKKHIKYEVGFTSSLETNAQKCKISFNFYNCKSECEFCNSDDKCWDQNWKFIYIKSDFEKVFFIIPCSIIVMLIVLALFTFAKCGVKEVIPNYGGENPAQNELPLIS